MPKQEIKYYKAKQVLSLLMISSIILTSSSIQIFANNKPQNDTVAEQEESDEIDELTNLLQQEVDNANNGDVINVQPGKYNNIDINKEISLVGTDDKDVYINHITINTDNVTIKNISFDNIINSQANPTSQSLYIKENIKNIKIIDNKFRESNKDDNPQAIIIDENCENIEIVENEIVGYNVGIHFNKGSSDITLQNNIINDVKYGIRILNSDKVNIVENEFIQTQALAVREGCSDFNVKNNKFVSQYYMGNKIDVHGEGSNEVNGYNGTLDLSENYWNSNNPEQRIRGNADPRPYYEDEEMTLLSDEIHSIILDKYSQEIDLNSGDIKISTTIEAGNEVKEEDKIVTWKSSNDEISTVDSKGNITLKSLGEVNIIAKVGDKQAICNLEVLDIDEDRIISKPNIVDEAVRLPQSTITNQLESTSTSVLNVEVKLPKDEDISKHIVSEDILNLASSNKKDITIAIKDEVSDKEIYSWTFEDEYIQEYKTINIATQTKDKDSEEKTELLFNTEGSLPGKITIKLNVDYKDGTKLRINKQDQVIKSKNNEVTVEDGYIQIETDKIANLELQPVEEIKPTPPPTGGGTTSPIVPPTTIKKLIGEDRYETAVKISKEGWDKSDTVILVNGNNDKLVDGLTAIPLASVKNSPVLLSDNGKLPKYTIDEITRLGPSNVIVIGGENTMPQSIIDKLYEINSSISIQRIDGQTRYETSLNIAKEIEKIKGINKIYVSAGDGEADSLSIASIAGSEKAPIILTKKNGLDKDTYDYIKSQNVEEGYIIGGSEKILQEAINQINEVIKSDISKNVIAGANRQETNAKVIDTFYTGNKLNGLIVVKEDDLVDALTVGAFASKKDVPIVLASDGLVKLQEDVLYNKKSKKVYEVGGGIPNSTIETIKSLVNNRK